MNISGSTAPSSATTGSGGAPSPSGLQAQIASLEGQIQDAKTDPKAGAKRLQELQFALRQLELRMQQRQELEASAKLAPVSEESAAQARLALGYGSLVDTEI
jgi:hypothetical protein